MDRIAPVILSLCLWVTLGCQTARTAPADAPPVAAASPVYELAGEEFETRVRDLTGTWTANIRAIYRGESASLPLGSEGADIGYLRVTVNVEIQDGRVFYGTFHAGDASAQTQEVFGAIRSDGELAHYVTANGRGVMYFRSDDALEICGGQGGDDFMLAYCSPLLRAE